MGTGQLILEARFEMIAEIGDWDSELGADTGGWDLEIGLESQTGGGISNWGLVLEAWI